MVSRIRPSSRVPRAAFVLAAALVGVVPFVEAGKPLPEVPLVVSFGAAPGMMIVSEAQPPSTIPYTDRQENVRAFLYPSGGFSFTTRADTAAPDYRWVCFGPGVGITTVEEPNPPAFPSGCWPLELQLMGQRITFGEEPVTIQTMAQGDSVVAFVRFAWKVGTDTYRLGYGTDMDGDGTEDSPPLTTTCEANVAGKCTTWTVASEGDHLAALFVVVPRTGKNGKVTWVNEPLGLYVMPFVQTLTVKTP